MVPLELGVARAGNVLTRTMDAVMSKVGMTKPTGWQAHHIVGEAYPGEPWIWRQGEGVRTIRDVLTEAGVDLLGWQIDVTALSADGRVIVGSGSDPSQKTGAWLAGLP